jgi:heme/copper-type cytochrome/quinol oxidase subunit 3
LYSQGQLLFIELAFLFHVFLASAVLFFEVMVLTGPLIDNMLSENKGPLAVTFGKALTAACGATFLLVASGFLVRHVNARRCVSSCVESLRCLSFRAKYCD